MKMLRLTSMFAGMFALSVSVHAQITPNASVTPNSINDGQSVTLIQDGYCAAGVAWTENVIWQPRSGADVLGNTSGLGSGSISYTPHDGPGTYWYQFRLVDNNINFQDEWVSFTVVASSAILIPNASVSPSTVSVGQSVTLTRDGPASAGVAWTENVIWQPNGYGAEVLGNMPLGTMSYTPHAGVGTYWYQFRFVDNNINFKDQWIPFTVVSDLLPISGYEIPYQPDSWGSEPVLSNSNCYNYALNLRYDGTPRTHILQPGQLAGLPANPNAVHDTSGNTIIQACIADAQATGRIFEPIGRYDQCPAGTYKVALVIDPDTDYHWYRQDPDGYWSSKRQVAQVNDVDAAGIKISDPQTCDRDYFDSAGSEEPPFETNYSVFVGYFAVSPQQ
jgi:hypothetical protein